MSESSLESHTWSPELVDAYTQDGFVIVPGVLGEDEVRELLGESRRLWRLLDIKASNTRIQWRSTIDGKRVADRLDPVFDISPAFEAVANDARLLGAVGAALGEPAAPFKCKLISKWSGTMGYTMHQDYPYWESTGVPAEHLINVQIAMGVCDRASGAIEVLPGLQHERLAAPEGAPLDVDESQLDLSDARLIELEPGDIALIHSMIPHRSGPNVSTRKRESLIVSYAPLQYGNLYERYHADRQDSGMPETLQWAPPMLEHGEGGD